MRRTNNRDFGLRRPTAPREQERRANQFVSAVFGTLALLSFGCAFAFDQPILALAAFIFLITAAVVAKDA